VKGGPRLARKLVSHWWGNDFKKVVLSILQDACGSPKVSVSEHFLKSLSPKVLRKTYWLCIFAVNQHASICGVCYKCKTDDYTRDPCRECKEPKLNPCKCGMAKFKPGDSRCEIDKFPRVMRLMTHGLMVALDSHLITLQRAWVVAEVGEALFNQQPIKYYGPADMKKGEICIVVQDCKATDAQDKDRILNEIQEKLSQKHIPDGFDFLRR